MEKNLGFVLLEGCLFPHVNYPSTEKTHYRCWRCQYIKSNCWQGRYLCINPKPLRWLLQTVAQYSAGSALVLTCQVVISLGWNGVWPLIAGVQKLRINVWLCTFQETHEPGFTQSNCNYLGKCLALFIHITQCSTCTITSPNTKPRATWIGVARHTSNVQEYMSERSELSPVS